MLQGSEFVMTKALFTWVAQIFCMQLSVQAWNLKKGPKLAVLAVQKFVQFRQSGSYKIYISSAGQVEPCKFLFLQKFVQTHVIGA